MMPQSWNNLLLRTTALGALLFTGVTTSQAASTGSIQHVIFIMQENRSFDNYFGTFPGADGIAMDATGTPIACLPLPAGSPGFPGCVKPFHDPHDINAGGQHTAQAGLKDIDGNLMDGFVRTQLASHIGGGCKTSTNPKCSGAIDGIKRHDAVGYHTDAELPNYWTYAKNFVLQDHLYESVQSWSLPAHLYMTSAWAADCPNNDPLQCVSSPSPKQKGRDNGGYPWTDITYLLDAKGVSWKYYLGSGSVPDCQSGDLTCPPEPQLTSVPTIWNPIPAYGSVIAKTALDRTYLQKHDTHLEQFYQDLKAGTLPAVSWIIPSDAVSEHPPSGVQEGMVYVTSLINAVMATGEPGGTEPNVWQNTAIFVAWDDWGGFYDHVPPPNADKLSNGQAIGYGMRVPGLIISPYVKAGKVDHQTVSFDSYLKFIEDTFLGGQRLDPKTDGRPDARPDVRESLTTITGPTGQSVTVGDLMGDFDFAQTPLAPIILSTLIPLHVAGHIDAAGATVKWLPITPAAAGGPVSYSVKKSLVSGGPYTVLAACSGAQFTAARCIDPAVTAGSTSYYVVSSTDPTGAESPNSTEISIAKK